MEELSYRNKFVRELVQNLTNYDDEACEGSTPQVIEGEDNLILIRVSLDEWKKIWASVYTGADICFPEESDVVRWSLLRWLECPMDLCALIAECIATSDEVRDAIRDFVTSDTEINNYFSEAVQRLTSTQVESNVIAGSCDPSIVAGKVIAIVERLNTINVDALEILEVGTNDEENVAALLEGIPVLGESPAGDIIQFAQGLLETFAETYVAAITEEWKDEVEEDLYCLALESESCELTYHQLFDYFQNRAASGLTIASVVSNVFQYVVVGDFSSDDLIASGMYAIQLALVLAGKEFFGMSLPRIGAITRDADPSAAWEDWEDCEAPEFRTPVVNSQWDPPNIAGTLSGPDEDGFYTLTSTDRTSDWAFVVMDVDDRQFVLTDITYEFRPQCQVLYDDPTMIYIGCPAANIYTGQTVTEFWSTWNAGTGPITMQFKMSPP